MVKSNGLMRGFERGRGALLVVIAVTGWSGSCVVPRPLWVGCLFSGCGRVVRIGGAIVGSGVGEVGGDAAIAADFSVLGRGGLVYVPFWTKSGGRLVKSVAGHGVVGCSEVSDRWRHIEIVASNDRWQGADIGCP